jgi:hypothetical protein
MKYVLQVLAFYGAIYLLAGWKAGVFFLIVPAVIALTFILNIGPGRSRYGYRLQLRRDGLDDECC